MQSGTFNGSLTPPSRKPLAIWTFRFVASLTLYVAIKRGATPFALVEPGCDTSEIPVLS